MAYQYSALLFSFLSITMIDPTASAWAAPPSICLTVEEGAPIVGLPTQTRIELAEGDTQIVSGHFTIEYDPTALSFGSVQPGAVCDATSPFTLLASPVVNETIGRIEFEVSVPLLEPGTSGPAVMACIDLIPIGNAATTVCVVDRIGAGTFLYDSTPSAITPVSSPECTAEAPAISCVEVQDPLPNECAEMDSDGDGDIDLVDYAAFQRCLTPPAHRAGR